MFTGLIERVGWLSRMEKSSGGARIVIGHEPWDEPLKPGESVAVQGVCLTVVRPEPRQFICDVLNETLKRTNLGAAAPGTHLNLERALRAGDRFGGHFVSGHVDGTGTVVKLTKAGRDWVLGIECSPELAQAIVMKGSIACDGVSLTVTAVSAAGFEVNLIPFTWSGTSLSRLTVGGRVNLETDLVGKYIRHDAESRRPESRVTLDRLRDAGFA